ncbi:MAG TPA: adenylate/guanylate cyclase domain-containing protein [Pyrinomonadaceae bacterium]|nr:adenylate/guanylate cyclase domain-containing protein [Pyrinomonadaceae bacterium]
MHYREFRYRWQYELKSAPDKLWPLVADTNRFNRDTGVPSVETEGKQRLRNARRRLRFSFLGLPLEWEELPFEWVRPLRFGVTRSYSKGPIAELRVAAELSARAKGGTHLSYQVSAIPKSLLGYVLIPLQIGLLSARKFRTAFKRYDAMATGEAPIHIQEPVDLLAIAASRLESFREKIVLDQGDPGLVEKLVDFVRSADDFSVVRIRPYVLADEWNEPRRAVLETCLRATRAGLLDMRWDLLCPLCRGPQESASSLREVNSKSHCDTCRINFTVNFDRYVEITFRPNASVRNVDIKDFCMGSPQRTPHVVAQQLLPPGVTRSLFLPLEKGNYRFRTLELNGEQAVAVEKEGSGSATLRLGPQGWSGDPLSLFTQSTLDIQNDTDAEQLFILERMQWSEQAATAAEVTVLQIFRDLFSNEALRPGEQISVGTITVLFTDLRDSTRLYRQIGDATAFGRVMNHFDVLKKAISDEGGALVKTIGDAVMAVFREPGPALRAMLTAQQILASPGEGNSPLTLKAGMHMGPCIAVTLNERLDYFGSTVNMAARLESLSSGNDVVVSREVFNDPEVRQLLGAVENNLQATPFTVTLKGFELEQFELWRIGRRELASACGSSRH